MTSVTFLKVCCQSDVSCRRCGYIGLVDTYNPPQEKALNTQPPSDSFPHYSYQMSTRFWSGRPGSNLWLDQHLAS